MSLPSFPRSVPTPGATLCSAGSLGSVPPLRHSYRGAPTSHCPDHARYDPRAVVPANRSGGDEISQVPGQSLLACRGLTPRWSRSAMRSRVKAPRSAWRCCLPPPMRRRPPRQSPISGPSPRPTGSLSTLRERSRECPRKTRFRLATSSLAGRDFHPRTALRSFRSLPPSSSARLTWRTLAMG